MWLALVSRVHSYDTIRYSLSILFFFLSYSKPPQSASHLGAAFFCLSACFALPCLALLCFACFTLLAQQDLPIFFSSYNSLPCWQPTSQLHFSAQSKYRPRVAATNTQRQTQQQRQRRRRIPLRVSPSSWQLE
ncbi:hypothetical protein GQ42DRAFT_26147 [Ramicandelaber brevisporus]|nr:hypothetical protein GQ42DRAFT_26147 [Ramicandelaber brevisporus]